MRAIVSSQHASCPQISLRTADKGAPERLSSARVALCPRHKIEAGFVNQGRLKQDQISSAYGQEVKKGQDNA